MIVAPPAAGGFFAGGLIGTQPRGQVAAAVDTPRPRRRPMTTGASNVIAAAAIVLVALVADDPAVLRNAPRDDAPAQATLWRGDWLEVRGETAGFLRVYDHRHERPGYIRPTIVRVHRLEAASAPELAAIVRFLRDANG